MDKEVRTMRWLQKFLYGRYGTDQLNTALLVTGIVLTMLLSLVGIPWLLVVAYIPLGVCIWRMFSRNRARRSYENVKFLRVWQPITLAFRRFFSRLKGMKTYRYFHCPKCRKAMRAPRGRGKISVTCRDCGHQFTTKV